MWLCLVFSAHSTAPCLLIGEPDAFAFDVITSRGGFTIAVLPAGSFLVCLFLSSFVFC